MIPSLNWLRVFEAAARCESFARAALQLNMSAAAVSQQVRALEERLGTALFERHAHAVTLTEQGRAYLPSVQQALVTLESATDGLFGKRREQQVFVQAVLLFAQGVLARGYTDFLEKHPGVSLSLTTEVYPHEFAKGFTDLQIVFGNPQAYGVQSDPLMTEILYPVASKAIAETIKSPSDLLRYRLIEVAPHRAGWAHVFENLGLLPGSAEYIYVDSTIMAMAMAREGVGVAMARAPAGDTILEEYGLLPCLPSVQVPGWEGYHLVYDDLSNLRAPARRFRSWLLDWCATRKESRG